MRTVWIASVAALAAGALLAGAAQAQHGGAAGSAGIVVTDADRIALFEARMAICKVVLKLTAEQEALWPETETALREAATARAGDATPSREDRGGAAAAADALTLLRKRADRMAEGSKRLRKLADAIGPLYRLLEDDQKRCLARLVPLDDGLLDGDGKVARDGDAERKSETRR